MKNFLLTAVALLLSVMAAAQTDYEMVVEKTDGSKSVFNTNIIKQTYFQKLDQEPGIFQGAKRVFGNYLVKAFGTEGQDRYEINYDANGFVRSINRTEYSEGGNYLHSWLFSYQTDGRILMSYFRDGMLDEVYYATVGGNGFISSIRVEQLFEATLSYDEEGHLVQIIWTDVEEKYDTSTAVETFTWMDGDLVRDNMVYQDDDDDDNSNISYISLTQAVPIENVAGIMDYYFGMGIDIEVLEQLYYIGGLGKGTKHLPMAWANDSNSGNNVWTLDSQNRPVKMVCTRKSYEKTDERTLFWEW